MAAQRCDTKGGTQNIWPVVSIFLLATILSTAGVSVATQRAAARAGSGVRWDTHLHSLIIPSGVLPIPQWVFVGTAVVSIVICVFVAIGLRTLLALFGGLLALAGSLSNFYFYFTEGRVPNFIPFIIYRTPFGVLRRALHIVTNYADLLILFGMAALLFALWLYKPSGEKQAGGAAPASLPLASQADGA